METIKRSLPNGRTHIVHRAMSVAEAARFAEANPNKKSSAKQSQNGWSGTPTLQDAVQLATDGWHEVRPEVDRMFHNLEDQIMKNMDEQFSTVYGYSGDMVDMGRYVAGDPECMVDYVTEPSARMGRVVRILVAGIASAYIEPEQIRARGVAVCALVDVLHKLGVGIELWHEQCYAHPNDERNKYSMLVKLHDSADTLDIDDVMYAIAHPSMLRRIGFAGVEQMEWARDYTSSGYGRVSDMQCGDMLGGEVDVVIEKLQNGGKWHTENEVLKDPVAWVLNTVKGLDLVD